MVRVLALYVVAAVVDHLRSSANNDVITRVNDVGGDPAMVIETIYHFAARHSSSSRAQLIIGTERRGGS